MKMVIQVPARCIIADSDERAELKELLGEFWGMFPDEYQVQHVKGHDIIPDRCFVYLDTGVTQEERDADIDS